MKNLIVSEVRNYDSGVKNGILLAVNSLNEYTYIATDNEVAEYSTIEKQTLNFVSLTSHGYLNDGGDECIICIDHLFDQEQLCIATSKGDLLLWQPEMNSLENAGSVDAGFTCVAWSPDQELLVLTTGNDTMIVMTKDFDPICEYPLHTDDFGEAKPINVGWGKKETQFHGSEGKEAAQVKKSEKSSPMLDSDDGRVEISWRGDGQLFAITSGNTIDGFGCRYIRVYDREGKLQATNEFIEGMEHCISWRPSGNLIACSQQKPNKHDVIFFEKNGLQHGEFTLPFVKGKQMITSVMWNSTSDILTIVSKEVKENQNTVQLWTCGNYHWYLKQEMHFTCEDLKNKPCVLWDPENCHKLHVLLPDGSYSQHVYIYDVIQSKGCGDNLAMVAVIDGVDLLLTPFKLMILPPPMATHTITMPASIQQVAFGNSENMHDVIVQLSNKQFARVKYNSATKSYEKILSTLFSESVEELHLRHLTYWKEQKWTAVYTTCEGEDSIAILGVTNEKIELVTSMKLDFQDNEKALKLLKNEDATDSLLLYTTAGSAYCIEDSNGSQQQILSNENNLSLPLLSSHVAVKDILGKSYVFGLTSHFRLQMNEIEIARDCTSFFIHDEFLLLTTHTHTLRCIYLNSLAQNPGNSESFTYDEAVRRVERGSKIVTAVRDGTAVILQMPRGNLECIHPRALVVTYLQKLLTSLKYKEALEIMRRNRINLNLLCDHDQQLFLQNTSKFIEEVDSANRINLFLADLSAEDVCTTLYFPFYHHGQEKEKSTRIKLPENKVDVICKAIRNAILQHSNKDKFYLSLLTSYAKESKPDLESVLLKIKQSKDSPSKDNSDSEQSKDLVSYEKALSYILYLVDVNQLFNIALGLYDFEIVLMVAEKSQKDPKEYLPFLNNFKNMEENYKKYSIDKYLKRYEKALTHIAKCDDRFNECLEFTREHNLYKEAMALFRKESENYKKISFEYGQYLHKNRHYEEAAIVFSRSGYHEEALESSKHTSNWNMTFMEAKLHGYNNQQLVALSRNRSHQLKGYRMFADAAYLLETYAKDIEESVVCLLEGSLWFQALNLILRYDRADLIETNLKPSILENHEQLSEKITDTRETFLKYHNRLIAVVENKKREDLEILEGIRDDPQNDLYSDTSSITGQSAISSAGSKGTRSSGHSRKSRNKAERKKYSLREGSKHEDFALREALAEIVMTVDKLKEEMMSLLKILMFYFYEEKAQSLQSAFNDMLCLIETHRNEIWIVETKDADTASYEFGPGATVQQILERKTDAANNSTNKPDLPKPTQPTIRTNVKWKLSIINTP